MITDGMGPPLVELPWEQKDRMGASPPTPRVERSMPGAEAPGQGPNLGACVETFREWLHLPEPGMLYVVLATVAANRGDGDPVWTLIVGPPGGGKTEILAPLTSLVDVHPAATITEAALLSGTPKRERATDAKGGLLREIGDFGIIVLKDFGSVLSMNRDTRGAVLAALREVYDGSWTRHVGTDGGKTLSWSGKVGLIAGCTPAIDSHHAVVGSMGERFVLYRLPPIDADEQARRAIQHVGHEATMRGALAAAVARVLEQVDHERLTSAPDAATVDRLVRMSTLAVRCRSAVERDSYSREVQLIPEAEAPGRLALVLLRLLNALRAIGTPTEVAWQLIEKCALDSMPAVRRKVLDQLIGRSMAVSTTEVAEGIGYPTQTTRRTLEDLTAHGIAERIPQGPGRADLWRVTSWTRDRMPTVPEMSDSVDSATVSEQAESAEPSPLLLPLRVLTDKSGKVPESEDELLEQLALTDDGPAS